MTSLEKLAEELLPHHNEICILHDMDLVRLVGVARDDMDLYYVVQQRDRGRCRPFSLDDGPDDNIIWASAVGHIRPLKDIYPSEDYERIENIFTMNGLPPAETFTIEDRSIWDDASSMDRMISKCGRFEITFDRDKPEDRFSLWRCNPEDDRDDTLIVNGEHFELEKLVVKMLDIEKKWVVTREEELAAIETAKQGA